MDASNVDDSSAASVADRTTTVEALCDAGLSLKDASAMVARLIGSSRREVYQQALAHRARYPA